MHPNDADWKANSVDPDQTTLSVCPKIQEHYGTLFAQTCLSENLGTLRYTICPDLSVWKFRNIMVHCLPRPVCLKI